MGLGLWTRNDGHPSNDAVHGLCRLCGHWSRCGNNLLVCVQEDIQLIHDED